MKWWQRFLLRRKIRALAESINFVDEQIAMYRSDLQRLLRAAHEARERLYWLEHGKVRDGTLRMDDRMRLSDGAHVSALD